MSVEHDPMKRESCDSFAKPGSTIRLNRQDDKETKCSFAKEGGKRGEEREREREKLGKQTASLSQFCF